MKSFSDRCKEIFIETEKLARVSNNLYVYPEHLALTIFSSPSYLIKKILNEFNLNVVSLISVIKSKMAKLPILVTNEKPVCSRTTRHATLDTAHCILLIA